MLDLILNNPSVSTTEIAMKLGLSSDTIKEYLERLKNKGILKRVGPDKGGYWEVAT
ncbi:winged helix-turn-helix transcriptional regulator [Candidatus Woesearchaeota archaeon]|nr:winged helix-turn-helix transcriptional regulator [Candidatus Woesearchaeota archaeon]